MWTPRRSPRAPPPHRVGPETCSLKLGQEEVLLLLQVGSFCHDQWLLHPPVTYHRLLRPPVASLGLLRPLFASPGLVWPSLASSDL